MPPANQFGTPSRFSFESVTLFVILASVIVAAIIIIPSSSIPFLSTKSYVLAIGAILSLALFILARLSRGNVILPPALLLGALVLPAVAYGLSSLFTGLDFSRALFGAGFSTDTFGFILTATVLGVLTALAFRRTENYSQFFKVGFWFAAAVIVLQLLILIVGQVASGLIPPSTPILGAVVDLSAFAGLVVIAVLLTLRLMPISGRPYMALLALALGAFIVLALYGSNLQWVIIGLVSLGLFVESVMRRSPTANDSDLEGVPLISEANVGGDQGERNLVAPLVALAISLFFLLGGTVGQLVANSLGVSVLDVRPSWQGTLSVGQEVLKSSPLFGSGPTTFGEVWLKDRDPGLNQSPYWNIDFTGGIGFLPTSFITTGILGMLAWLLLIAAFVYQGVRSILLTSTSDPYLRYATVLAFSAGAYLFIIAFASNAGAISIALLFVFLGLFTSLVRHAPNKTQWGVIFAKSPRIGFVIVFLLTIVLLSSIAGAYTIVERYLADINALRGANALAVGDLAVAKASADASIALSPTTDAYRIRARAAQGQMTRIANDSSLSATAAQQSFQEELAAGITAAVSATRLAPNEYQNWVVLGDLYTTVVPLRVEGAEPNAKEAYLKAEALHPTSPLIPYALAQLAIGAGKTSDAREALTKAITLKQDYTPAIFLLSQLEVASGNVNEALKAAEAAAYFTPNDPGVLFQLGVLRAATGNTNAAIEALMAATSADPKFANAHYFLAALYAKQRSWPKAIESLETIATISEENANLVAPLLEALRKNRDPFPANLLSLSPPAR